MLVDVQMSQCDSPVHVQCFPTERGKQTIMTSFSDVTNVILMHRVGGYIKRACMSLEAIVWVFGAELSDNLLRKPLTLCHGYFSASCGARVHSYRRVFFVYLHVPKGILDTLS